MVISPKCLSQSPTMRPKTPLKASTEASITSTVSRSKAAKEKSHTNWKPPNSLEGKTWQKKLNHGGCSRGVARGSVFGNGQTANHINHEVLRDLGIQNLKVSVLKMIQMIHANCRTCNGNVWKLPDSVASFFPLFFLIKLFLWEFCWVGVPTVSPVSAVVGTSSFPSTKPGQWHRRGMGEGEATQSGLSSGTTNGWWNSGCQPSFVPFFGLTIRVNVLNCWGLTSWSVFVPYDGFYLFVVGPRCQNIGATMSHRPLTRLSKGQSGQGICTNWYNFLKSNPW